jgi:hypothetical protein
LSQPVPAPQIRFLHPELAAERSCDLGRGTIHTGREYSYAIKVSLNEPLPDYSERYLACMLWQAHYWGRPDRNTERNIALVRGIAAGHGAETMLPLMVSLWNSWDSRRPLERPKNRAGLGRSRFQGPA